MSVAWVRTLHEQNYGWGKKVSIFLQKYQGQAATN